MSDAKKDLTGLMDYAKKMEAEGQAVPTLEGSVMEEPKIDKVESFESLDEYGKANPVEEPPAISLEDPFAASAPQEEPGTKLDFSASADEVPESVPGLDTTPVALPEPTPPSPFELAPPEPFHVQEPHAEVVAAPDAPDNLSSLSIPPEAPAEAERTQLTEPLRPAIRHNEPLQEPIQKIRQYSEQLTPGHSTVPAAFPFSLLITGELAPEEKERLIDLLGRENMGIRELDLDPQFESGKILIPRISEYAGVLIVSALRSARVKMRLGPSDTIFATADTQDAADQELIDTGEKCSQAYSADLTHPAETLPITNDARLPHLPHYTVVDVVTASAALKTLAVEADASAEYQELLEALQRELKYKAHRKGAQGIVNFSVQLTQLHLPSHYRVLVTGSAIKTL